MVTIGHLRVTEGHPGATIGHPRVIMDHLRLTILYTAELSDRSSLVTFQNYKFNCATENRGQLLSVFVSESVVMAGILNTTFVHSTHLTT